MTTKRAYAKVNLVLDVLYTRQDSYHELAGIMHSIDLYDEVGIEPASLGISVKCNEPLPENNTAFRAASLYLEATGINTGLVIDIKKNIPSQAGLGGASADAAAVLTLLQDMYAMADTATLYDIAKRVGADVPFCLHGGCAKVCGIGEKLTALPTQELWLLLIKRNRGISTKELFALHDKFYGIKLEDERLNTAIQACIQHDKNTLALSLFNTLETAAFALIPELCEDKERLLSETPALTALMTGSGSVVYGVYENEADARNAAEHMKKYGYDFILPVKTR